MKRLILVALLLSANAAHAVTLTQADCNFSIERLKAFNADSNAHPGKRTTFEEKAVYAYAEACQRAGLVTIYGYLEEVPEASPEITKFCRKMHVVEGNQNVACRQESWTNSNFIKDLRPLNDCYFTG